MRRGRARLIAVAVVVSTVLVSIAQASFLFTQDPATTEPAPLTTAMRILVSVRNGSAGSQTITMIGRSPTGNGSCPPSVQIAPAGVAPIPHELPPYSQAQFVISSTGFGATDPMPATCVWDVTSSDLGVQQFTTVFSIVPTSTVTWDVQPKLNDFGSQSETNDSETQKILINNYLNSAATFTDMVIDDPTGSIRFVSDCPGQQTCTGPFALLAKAARTVEIACDPTSAVAITGTFQLLDGGNPVATTNLTCQGTPGGGGGMIDIIPALVSLLGTTGFPVSTGVMITSNPSGDTLEAASITGIDAAAFTFINNASCFGQSCTFGIPGIPLDTSLEIECTPTSTIRTAMLTVQGANGGTDVDTAMLSCSGTAVGTIDIVPALVSLFGTQGVPISTGVMITSNPVGNSLQSASITGTDASQFTFINNAECVGQACAFATPVPLDTSLDIECTPSSTPRNATLVVQGTNGSFDMDMAMLSCGSTGGGPSIFVSPLSITATPTLSGGTSGPYMVTIMNTALSGPNLVATVLLSDPTNWTADNCVSSACSLPPGTPAFVNVYFTPMSVGPLNSTLTVDSNAGMPTVMLFGSGGTAESRLDVDDPSSFQLDFGPLARNEMSTRSVTLRATGPSGYMVTLTDPGGVYTLSQLSLTMAANDTAMFDVTCQSPTPSGPNPATITISALPVPTVQNSTTIDLTCTIVDTDVQVTPTMFAFGEVRVATAERRLPFTIHNTGSDVMIDFVRIAPARPGLSVTSIPAQLLTSGSDLTGDVIVTPAQDVDLAGAFLEIGIVGEPVRQLPITGQVVTPRATVTPASLDLGTVCIGTQIGGQLTMSNTGTATLHVERPVMDQTSFTVSATPPDVYPLDLAPDGDATITISPSTSAMGMVANALTWSVDAPGSPFRVPVTMTFVSTGGAVSPGLVAFPALDVFATSADRKITLQNCSEIDLPLTIGGVVATTGDASAWTVAPRTLQRTLAPKETVEVIVRFTPKSPGEHHARLVIEIGGEDRSVLLEGFADGEVGDRTSFYACSCSGPGAPSRGWPIALAIALILRRRRR